MKERNMAMQAASIRPGFATVLFLAIASALLASCATKLPEIPADLTSSQIIQRAQERSDLYDWKGASYYYNALLERFPDDAALEVNARYELAFIQYKQRRYQEARKGFTAVLEIYASPKGASLPRTWKILTEKVMAKLPPEGNAATPAK
jgi:outer membrane protein assembly factor BamD (BamD/ComL family)